MFPDKLAEKASQEFVGRPACEMNSISSIWTNELPKSTHAAIVAGPDSHTLSRDPFQIIWTGCSKLCSARREESGFNRFKWIFSNEGSWIIGRMGASL